MSYQLQALKNHYRTALYTYFRINNLAEVYEQFQLDPNKTPVFTYSNSVSERAASRRLLHLKRDLAKYGQDDKDITVFLERRILETRILKRYCALNNKPDKVSQSDLDGYLSLQTKLYGEVSSDLYEGILSSLEDIAKKTSSNKKQLPKPDKDTFRHYKELFNNAFPELNDIFASIPSKVNYPTNLILGLLSQALISIDADKAGWAPQLISHGSHVVVAKHSRKVLISDQIKPHTALRLKQIIAHEIACHVQRTLGSSPATNSYFANDEEGLAIVLEQLVNNRFTHKRTMRYLALCLALGQGGQPRNFIDTYDVMLRAMLDLGNSEDKAKLKAFYETSRVFRGGFPEIAGGVYIKDKIYLESNLRVWEQLKENHLDKDRFERLFRSPELIKQGVPA